MEELETIVTRLEGGKVPPEESVAIYERGESLKRRCEALLRQAEARVDKITTDANGQVTGTEPLDVQGTPRPPGSRSTSLPGNTRQQSANSPPGGPRSARVSSWRATRHATVPRLVPCLSC